MVVGKTSARSLGASLARFVQLFFSPSFPLVLVSLCSVSYLLAANLHAPELGLWALVATWAIRDAKYDNWAAIAFGLIVVAAPPLAWLAFRQRETRRSRAIAEWVVGAVVIGLVFSLRVVWPYDGSDQQVFVYSFLLFIGWNALVQAVLSSLAIAVHGRKDHAVTADRIQEPSEA
jgi:FtsH-binding integral membrane protein